MDNKIILADYTALVEVTDEMRKLRECPANCKHMGDGFYGVGPMGDACPKCLSTGLNPDQSAWWEALENAEFEESLCKILLNIPMEKITFCEAPSGRCGANLIHRPSGDNRPWPEVLEELVYQYTRYADESEKGISFALATPETAPVFKSFGIKTLVEA